MLGAAIETRVLAAALPSLFHSTIHCSYRTKQKRVKRVSVSVDTGLGEVWFCIPFNPHLDLVIVTCDPTRIINLSLDYPLLLAHEAKAVCWQHRQLAWAMCRKPP